MSDALARFALEAQPPTRGSPPPGVPLEVAPGLGTRRTRRVRVAVIGAGFGGLAAAIRLQSRGVDTVIYEALDRPGGRAYVYQDNGYTFDAGPTVITAPSCIEELFTDAGRCMIDYVELLPVHPFYRLLWEDGSRIDYDAQDGQMEREIERLCPRDLQGYRRFLDYASRVFAAGYEKLAGTPFLHFSDMIRAAPALVRLRADRSVYRTVARFVRDERLRQALSFHALLVGGNPFETSAIYTLIHHLERRWGVFFARGGTGALVQALARLYSELGGHLRLACPIDHVEVERTGPSRGHWVVTRSGERQRFDRIVSNADLHHTFSRLYRGHPEAARKARKLEGMAWSMSLFVLYFGTRKRYPGLAHHTVLFGKRYRTLLHEIFHGPTLPDDFSLYLHAPTVTDPSLAPPGGETFYVLAPVPHLRNAAVDWHEHGEMYADRILHYLERTLPGLRNEIVTRRIFTPLDFQSRLGAFAGSAFSLAPRLGQSAYFRPHNRDPHIEGLYLVGAGTHPGAGVPGVINSAKATVTALLEDIEREVGR